MKARPNHKPKTPDGPVRVCFVAHTAGNLGAEAALFELLEALTNKGIKCYVLLPCDGPFTERLRSLNLSYSIIPYKSWLYKKASIFRRIGRAILNIFLLIRIVTQIKRWQCHMVYTNTIMIFVGALAARTLGIPHLWHIHEFGREDHGFEFDFGERFCGKFMNRFSDMVICVSNSIATKYERYIDHSKLKVVYQSVTMAANQAKSDSRKEHPGKNSRLTCAIIGNINKGKRQEDAITAIIRTINLGINAQLYIIGEGERDYKSHLLALTDKHGMTDRIHFMGYRDDCVAIINSIDIVLTCSRCEGFGRITVHGMLCGKPIIGTNSGCTSELIKNGYNGLLYEPGDSQQLANHIIYLYSNPHVMKRLGRNGKQWAESLFTKTRYGNEMETLFRQLVNDQDY